MKRLLYIAVSALLCIPMTVHAQETVPGDSCTAGETGFFKRSEGADKSDGFYFLWCDGSNWNQALRYTSSQGLSLSAGDASGYGSTATSTSTASGSSAAAFGAYTTASGPFSTATGYGTTASGNSSVAVGYESTASGASSVVMGHKATAGDGTAGSGFGDYSMAIGLGNASTSAYPQVTGDSSLGIFMGDQQGYDLTTSYRMALVGGDFLIDNDGSAGSQGCIRYSGTQLEYSDDCSTYSAFGGGSGLWTAGTGDDIYYNSGSAQVGIGTTTPTASLHVQGNVAIVDDAPDAVYVLGGSGTGNGVGGRIYLKAGPGSGSGKGGNVSIIAGDPSASGADGGDIFIQGGESSTAGSNGGNVTIAAGNGVLPPAGNTYLYGGAYGAGGSGDPARAYLRLAPGGSSTAGSVVLSGGGTTGLTGSTGNVSIYTQNASFGSAGYIKIQAGNGGTGDPGGAITLTAGNAGTGNINGSDITLNPGALSGTGTDGNILLASLRGNVGIANASPNAELDVTGDIEYTGSITDMSDRRLKTDIENLPSGQLSKVMALQGVSFRMKETPEDGPEYGFIAQDVREIYPTLIYERGGTDLLSMNYVGLIAPMVEAIKEQQSQIEALEARLRELEAVAE